MQTSVAPGGDWRRIRCGCGRKILFELRGAGPVEIRIPCRRCNAWWVVDGMTGRVRGEAPREPVITTVYQVASRA
jgi:hypothetical protein